MHRINGEVLFVCLFSKMFAFTMSLEETNSFDMEALSEKV